MPLSVLTTWGGGQAGLFNIRAGATKSTSSTRVHTVVAHALNEGAATN